MSAGKNLNNFGLTMGLTYNSDQLPSAFMTGWPFCRRNVFNSPDYGMDQPYKLPERYEQERFGGKRMCAAEEVPVQQASTGRVEQSAGELWDDRLEIEKKPARSADAEWPAAGASVGCRTCK